jgi:hypothetical protein
MKKFWFSLDIIAIVIILGSSLIHCNTKGDNQNKDDYPISDSQYVDTLLRDTASKIVVPIEERHDSTVLTYVKVSKDGNLILTDSQLVIPNHTPYVNPIKMADDMLTIVNLNNNWVQAKDRLYKQLSTDETDTTKVNEDWDIMDAAYKNFSKAMSKFKKKYKAHLKL